MRRKSSVMTLVFAMMTLVLFACSDNDENNPNANNTGKLNISTTELTFGVDGGEATFSVDGGTAYVRSESNWISVSRVSGDSKSSTFSVVCEANKDTARVGSVLASLNGAFERITVTQAGKVVHPDAEQHTFRTASEIAKDMYPGWNLGNTMEATGNGVGAETTWQPTKTSQEIINFIKSQGFKSVRIPCSWYIHSKNGKIDEEWMARVKEVVDYCVNAGLYVLLNDHWDGGWIEELGFSKSAEKYQKVDDKYVSEKATALKSLWLQIATAFQGYDEHVLFAGLNEPFQNYNLFNGRDAELTPILLTYNQAFVDVVRSTGGNNANRILVVQGPSTNIDLACKDAFTMPTDVTEGRLMVECHYYDPWSFAGDQGNSAAWFWGEGNKGSNHNATYSNTEAAVKSVMAKMHKKFVSKGIPAIIGEYAAQWREVGSEQELHDKSVKAWFKSVTLECGNYGIVPMAWDINSLNRRGTQGTMTIIDRTNLKVFNQPALDGIKEGVSEAKWPN